MEGLLVPPLAAVLAPSGVIASRCDGDLVLDGMSTRCAAWWLLDIENAWRYGNRRGQNRVMAGTSGRRFERRLRDSTVYDFRMVFGGRFDRFGVATAIGPAQQLRVNFDTCRLNWVDDTAPASAVTSSLYGADGTHVDCDVQVLDLVPGRADYSEHDAVMRASLIIEVPRGGWVD